MCWLNVFLTISSTNSASQRRGIGILLKMTSREECGVPVGWVLGVAKNLLREERPRGCRDKLAEELWKVSLGSWRVDEGMVLHGLGVRIGCGCGGAIV